MIQLGLASNQPIACVSKQLVCVSCPLSAYIPINAPWCHTLPWLMVDWCCSMLALGCGNHDHIYSHIWIKSKLRQSTYVCFVATPCVIIPMGCTTHHNLNASCVPLVRCGSCHLLPMHGRNVRHALLVPPNMCTCSSLSHLKALHKSPLRLYVHLAFNHMPFMKPRWYPWGFGVACLSQNANNSPPVNDFLVEKSFGVTFNN